MKKITDIINDEFTKDVAHRLEFLSGRWVVTPFHEVELEVVRFSVVSEDNPDLVMVVLIEESEIVEAKHPALLVSVRLGIFIESKKQE